LCDSFAAFRDGAGPTGGTGNCEAGCFVASDANNAGHADHPPPPLHARGGVRIAMSSKPEILNAAGAESGAPSPADHLSGSLAPVAMRSMFWSLVQNWGGRMTSFVQFVILAQYLSPQDFGLAAAATIITVFITLVAEFGFADALIQRRDLKPEEVNLPFYLAVGTSVAMAIGAILAAPLFESWLNVRGLAIVLMALSPIAPITTVSLFQEAYFKRELAFKPLAFRVMIANVVATCVSVPCAILGLGVWSLVVQSYLAAIIGTVWIWHKPLWKPGRDLRPGAARELFRFGFFVLAMRVLDFGATRLIEVLMIGRHGVKAYGYYTASSRLNQTLMDLLQSALNDVSLSLLSKISSQRERIAAVYRTSIAIAGNLVPPVFVCVAALSPEICAVLFDARWNGIDRIATPLFLLGAVQSLQFFSRPYLNARGRSELVLVISTVKFLIVVAVIVLAPSRSIFDLITYFVLAQLASAPVSFGLTARELRLPFYQIYVDLLPIAISCAAGYFAAGAARGVVGPYTGGSPLLSGIALGVVFGAAYAAVILLIGRRQLFVMIDFFRVRIRERMGA
jgi:O-antigen/teichoic acid export membrane protein